MREARRQKLVAAHNARVEAAKLEEEASLLQSEEADLQERARFLSRQEEQLLDAFDNVEDRGGGSERVDPSLEAVLPASEGAMDEWLRLVGPDFFVGAPSSVSGAVGSAGATSVVGIGEVGPGNVPGS